LRTERALTSLLRRDRLIVVAALALVTALAWAWLFYTAMPMAVPSGDGLPDMSGMKVMPAMAPTFTASSLAHALVLYTMWTIMMIGMMAPSVSPMILIYVQVARHADVRGVVFAPAVWFGAGYLTSWLAFAGLATAAQWGLERAALLTPMMASSSALVAGLLLLLVGVYQLTPIKDACLIQCRAPLAFIQAHGGFQRRRLASLKLGALHGAYCVGCCWALMALLFVGGVMNLLWVAGLAVLVLLEKLLRWGKSLGRAAGAAAILAGLLMLSRYFVS
jgi:predicted metal-binding membrane protein